ncbi:hypothetical protein [Effusibacillus consociatus]
MKNAALLLLFLGFTLFVTGCSNSSSTKPQLTEIESITIVGPCTGALCDKSFTLYPSNPDDRKIIDKIANWFNLSHVVGDAKNELIAVGSSPRRIEIKLKNGEVLRIQSAVESVEKTKDGYEVTAEDVMNQITVYQTDKKPLRVNSPEIKAWINEKWREDITNDHLVMFRKSDIF